MHLRKGFSLSSLFNTEALTPTLNRFFDRLVQSADNFGDTDEWRALNFLAVRNSALYHLYAKMVGSGNYIFDSIRVIKSRLSGERSIVDPVFSFVEKKTGVVEKYFVRVDVSHLFPMLVHQVDEYFDR